MNMPGSARKWRWTRLTVTIWLLALLVVLAVVILVATGVIGSWALLVNSAIVLVVVLLGYRAETERPNQDADQHDG
jgi:hypothetical protein